MATIFEVYIANALTELGLTDLIPIGQTPGSPADAAIAFSHLLAQLNSKVSQNDTVVGSNITLVESTIHNQTIAGLTANRQNIFPVPSAIGKEITINILDGDADYVMIPIGAATVTLNGGSAATANDAYRIWIAKESTTWISTSLTNWQIKVDGRIPSFATFHSSAISSSTHTAAWIIKPDWDSFDTQKGDCGDLANNRFVIKRPGNYSPTGGASFEAITDQKYANIQSWKNGVITDGVVTDGTKISNTSVRQSSGAASSILGVSLPTKPHQCVVDDYIEYYFATEEANKGLLDTDYAAGGYEVLANATFFTVLEIL